MAKKSWLIPSLIVLGIVSLLLSLLIATQTENQKMGEQPIARIDLNLGKVFILRKNMTQKEQVTRRSSLFALDSVETEVDGDATMDFDSSYRIRIQENSLVTLARENDHIVLIIKRGDLQVENYGKENSVFISRDGVRWNATEYEQNYKKQPAEQNLPDLAPEIESSLNKDTKSESGLTSEYIQETLRLQRGAFFKCYTQLLQKTPGLAGQAALSFTIEKNGKVFNAEVASSNITDSAFKKCLIDAIHRVEFKSFEGDPISTVFPLKFE